MRHGNMRDLRECEAATASHLRIEQGCCERGDVLYLRRALELALIAEEAGHRCRNQLKAHIIEHGGKRDVLGDSLDDDLLEAFVGQQSPNFLGITKHVFGALRSRSAWAE